MAKKLYLVELEPECADVDRILVKANSPLAAKKAVIEAKLVASKVDALEVLALMQQDIPIIEASEPAAPEDAPE